MRVEHNRVERKEDRDSVCPGKVEKLGQKNTKQM